MSDTPGSAPAELYASAVKTLGDIYHAFGLTVPEVIGESSLLSPILEGRLVFNARNSVCEYMLAASLELKDKSRVETVTFREASGSDLEYIRAGSRIRADKSVDLGDLASMTLRVLVKVGDLATGVADRIKARDVDELCNIFSDLGFFGR